MYSRRALLSGTVPTAIALTSGCIDLGRSETERAAISAYEQVQGHHASGIELLEDGLSETERDAFERAGDSFDGAVSAFESAAEELDRARAHTLETGSTDGIELLATANHQIVEARATAQRAADAASSLVEGTDRSARQEITDVRDRFERGEFQLPPVDAFEDAL